MCERRNQTRLELMQGWRAQALLEHETMDLKRTAFQLAKPPGLMFQVRAERVARLDRIIERLKHRSEQRTNHIGKQHEGQ